MTIDQQFNLWAHVEEIKLRGTYVNMAVDVDIILAMIIAETFKYNDEAVREIELESGRKRIPLHKLTMFEKVDVCKKGLEKYHKDLYDKSVDHLSVLDVLRAWRNLFAHQKMDFQNEATIRFTELMPEFKTSSVDYDVKKLWSDLLEYRKSVMESLDVLKHFVVRA